MSLGTVNLALCTEVQVENCKNSVFCCCRNRHKKRRKTTSSNKEKRNSHSDFALIDAPRVDIHHLSAEDLETTDFYIFNTDLKYIVAQGENIHKKYMEISQIIGSKVSETNLPKPMENFLTKFYEETLKGHHLQTTIFWEECIYLMNTFPIKNHLDEIIGGLLTCTHSGDTIPDVSKFRLEKI